MNVVFIPNIDLGDGRANSYHYSVDSWSQWCKKNDCELLVWEDLLYPIDYMKITWQRYYLFDILKSNDIEYDRSGRIYFSSRGDQADPNNYNKKAVYRLDPDGSLHQLLSEPEVHMPNGLVISPDESTLYLIEAHPNADHNRCILAFDLRDGELSNRRTLINFYPGRSGDGMCIDREGNLYVAAGLHAERGTSETLDTKPGIHVISPEGKLLAYLMTPNDTITNCTFGGPDLKTLYITAGLNLISMQTKIAGKDSYRVG